MKKYLFILLLFITVSTFTGCYTVIWSPEEGYLPKKETVEYVYYSDNYYGSYGGFYEYPWWYNYDDLYFDNNDNTIKTKVRTETSDNSSLRRNDGSRYSEPERTSIPIATRDRNNDNDNSSSGSSSSSTSTETSKTRTESSSSSSSSSSSTRSSSSSGSSIRNNDGNRNDSGSRRR